MPSRAPSPSRKQIPGPVVQRPPDAPVGGLDQFFEMIEVHGRARRGRVVLSREVVAVVTTVREASGLGFSV